MTKFRTSDATHKILKELGLEYRYSLQDDGGGPLHRNLFCQPDGTVILEANIQEEKGRVLIKDSRRIREYLAIDIDLLDLLIINVGGTLLPKVPYIFIRILHKQRLLHHSEHKL